MLGTPRNSTSTSNNSLLSGRTVGFVPTAPTSTNLVDVVVLARKGSNRDSILQANAQGKERDQVLLNLVGVRLPKLDAEGNVVMGPQKDAEGNTVLDAQGQPVMAPVKVVYPGEKLPPLGSKHFDIIMNQPTGIFVESIYEAGQHKLEELIDGGYLQGVTRDGYNDAKAKGNLNRLLANAGMFLRSIDGIFETQQLTVKDIMAGEKTLSVSFFGGEGQAFAESFERLQKVVQFRNVAMCARMSPKMGATQLGDVGISYQPDEVHFFWVQTSVNNRTQYMLDARYAKSGLPYSSQTVNAANASDLAQRGTQANYGRNMQAIQQGTKNRKFANDTVAQIMVGGGIKVPAEIDTGEL